MNKGSPRAISMFLHQNGERCDVYTEDRDRRDALNHPVEDFSLAGTTLCLRHYGGAIDEERDYPSGRRVKETPTLVFPLDTIAENNCHILYRGTEYEVTAMTNRGTHWEANAKSREEGSVLDG